MRKYESIKKALLDAISSGRLKPGDRAGSESVLAREHGVSKFSVIKAFTELVNEGVLWRRQGKGTFVTQEAPAVVGRLGESRSVRFCVPYRRVNDVLIRPGLEAFRERFGEAAIELVDEPSQAEVLFTSASLSPRGAAELLPLGRFIPREEQLRAFRHQALESLSRSGELYSLPRDVSPVMLYYNADLFRERGVDLPDDSWRWEDLARAAARLTDAAAGRFGYAAGRGMIFLLPFILQAGGRLYDSERDRCALDEPEAVEALRFYRELERSSPVTAGGITYESMLDEFAAGRIAMIGWGGAMGAILSEAGRFEWGAARMPAGRVAATTRFACGVAISKAARDPELAWELARSVAGPGAQAALAERGYLLPVAREVEVAGDLAGRMTRILDGNEPHEGHERSDVYHVACGQLVELWDEIPDDAELAREVTGRVNTYLELAAGTRAARSEAALI